MPLTCNVGLSKKVGLPDYGSLGASCSVQFELDAGLLTSDLTEFNRQIQNAYVACSQVVNDELSRQQGSGAGDTSRASQSQARGNGQSNGHLATEKQLDYARQLAGQIRGLGVRRLEALASKMFGKPVADLTTLDASGLIDTLKAIKSGELNLDDALGATA